MKLERQCSNCAYGDVTKDFVECDICKSYSEWKPIGAVESSSQSSDKKLYAIEKEGFSNICVKLTENEARTLENFLDWACLDEKFTITPAEKYAFEEWGEKS